MRGRGAGPCGAEGLRETSLLPAGPAGGSERGGVGFCSRGRRWDGRRWARVGARAGSQGVLVRTSGDAGHSCPCGEGGAAVPGGCLRTEGMWSVGLPAVSGHGGVGWGWGW